MIKWATAYLDKTKTADYYSENNVQPSSRGPGLGTLGAVGALGAGAASLYGMMHPGSGLDHINHSIGDFAGQIPGALSSAAHSVASGADAQLQELPNRLGLSDGLKDSLHSHGVGPGSLGVQDAAMSANDAATHLGEHIRLNGLAEHGVHNHANDGALKALWDTGKDMGSDAYKSLRHGIDAQTRHMRGQLPEVPGRILNAAGDATEAIGNKVHSIFPGL